MVLLGWVLCPPLDLLSHFPRTPLHAAAFADNIHGLQLLLRHQAEVDMTDKLGRTPLMMASENGHTAAVGTCLAVSSFSMGCKSPCPSSVTGSHGCWVVPLLIGTVGQLPLSSVPSAHSHCPTLPGSVLLLLNSSSPLLISEFLLYQAKANITVLDVNKNTALHLACSKVGAGRSLHHHHLQPCHLNERGCTPTPALPEQRARALGLLCLPAYLS